MRGARGSKNARTQRVESQLQRVVAELISRDVRDPRVGSVTITSVEVAPDMSSAKVYFVPFGNAHSVEEVQAGLARAASFMRGEVGRRLALRHAPRLDFRFDETIERGTALSALISSAVREDSARASHESSADAVDDPADPPAADPPASEPPPR
jgi:ribosome-binding factor A